MKPISWPLPGNAPRLLFVAAAVFLLLTAHFLLFQFHTAQAQGDIIYVNAAANGAANGSSWDDAYTSLQDALAGAEEGDEIWIAAGIYYPDEGMGQTADARDSRFNITPGVSVYGGFAGTETELEERDWEANPTVLSGDIDHETNPDEVDAKGVVTDTANIKGANAYHVVWLSGATTAITASTLIDGVIITAGQASVSPLNFPQNSGGGLFCGGRVNVCDPMLSNVTFSGNSAYRGGAMFNDGHQGQSSPTLSNVTFSGNSAYRGGAMFNDGHQGQSSPTLSNVTFSGNWAENNGAAMYNDGRNGGASSPTLTNVTFSGNWAENNGGAMYNTGNNGASSPILTNVILWDNSAGSVGDAMYNIGQGAAPTIAYSLVQGGLGQDGGIANNNDSSVNDDGGNIDADPLFVTPVNPADAPTTAGDLRLLPGSPAINAGDNDVLPAGLTTDLDGNPRIEGGMVDMGAYEFQFECAAVGSRLYVDSDATGVGDGSSWDDASTSLRYALLVANICGHVDEIWMAEGVYTPGFFRSDSFNIPSGVSLYGGFAGDETQRDQRKWDDNPTVLSGDIGGDDVTDARGVVTDTVNIVGDNAYHVVKLDGTTTPITASTRIDGVVITAGHANGGGLNERGGGLFCDGREAGSVCSPTLTNVIFSGNLVLGSGAAMYNEGRNGGQSSPTLTNVTFSSNRAGINGGAMYNYGVNGESSPTLTNVTFAGNRAEANGGAIFNNGGNSGQSSPTLTNVTFSGNRAGVNGGAMFSYGRNGGQIHATLTNVTFAGNRAENNGGAMYNDGDAGDESSPTLTNVILWGNSAGVEGDVMFNLGATPTIAHSLVEGGWDGSGIAGSSGTDGGNNIDGDPLFMTPINPADAPTTAGDLRLRPGSPAIDAGDDGALPPGVTTDLAGGPRLIGGAVDMGAYEFMPRLYVDRDASGNNNGSSWSDAFTSLQDALLLAYDGSEIWVAEGIYTPGANVGDSFNIPPGVSFYGGFAGIEDELEERDWEAHPTVLSGDIGGDDVTDERGVVISTANIVGDNALHVVTLDGTTTPITASTRLDGVIITAGQANGSDVPDDSGGGLYCNGSGADGMCSPVLSNISFAGNSAAYGGAMYNDGRNGGTSSPTLTNVTYSGNQADSYGGAMYNDGGISGESSPTLTNAAFSGNRAGTGGGAMYNNGGNSGESSPTLTNVNFAGNGAQIGGAMYNVGGGDNGQSSPTLTNVVFSGNQAGLIGGALVNDGEQGGTSSPTLTNVTFSGNSAAVYGGAMFNFSFDGESSPALTNVILWDNSAGHEGDVMYNDAATPTIAYSLVQGGLDGDGIANSNDGSVIDDGGNIDGDPLFVTPVNPDDAPTIAGDLRLRIGSPAIDAGDNDALPAGLDTDLDGSPRIKGGAVDMGAYEYIPALLAVEMTPSSVVEDSGQALTVTFNRTQNTVGELVVAFDVGGTATFNDDYVQFGATSFDGSSGTVTLGDGVISHTLLITPTADSVVEPDETVTLTLIPGVFYEVEAAATVTGTILNDDDPPPAEYWAYLPLLFSPLPPPGLPDLVVQELAVSGDGVTVIIANVGESAVVDPFWVDVYIDPDPVPTGANQIWPLLAEEGLAWGIGGEALPLQPGASLTLTVGDDYFVPDASHFSGAIAVGAALYAQVDSAHSDTDYGAVLEAHEADGGAYNNVAGPVLTPGTLIMSWSQAVSPSASGLLPPR